MGFPGGAVVKNPPANAGDSGDRKTPWSRKWQPTPLFLPEKSHGQKSPAATVHGDHKESDTAKHAHPQNRKGSSISDLQIK